MGKMFMEMGRISGKIETVFRFYAFLKTAVKREGLYGLLVIPMGCAVALSSWDNADNRRDGAFTGNGTECGY